jgi:hypothetical protein
MCFLLQLGHRYIDNINMNFIQKEYDGVEEIQIVLNRNQYSNVVNATMKFRSALTVRNYLMNRQLSAFHIELCSTESVNHKTLVKSMHVEKFLCSSTANTSYPSA